MTMALYLYTFFALFVTHLNGACKPIEDCVEPRADFRDIICTYTQQELQDIRSRYERIIECGRPYAPQAAFNLQYFLDGSGENLTISSAFLSNSWAVQDQIKENIETIICGTDTPGTGIIGRGEGLSVGESMEQQICWCESGYANPFTDLYFASGGFTIQTSVDVCITRVMGEHGDTILFKMNDITHRYYDPYNWEPNLGVYGAFCQLNIPDKAAYCLDQTGMAKSFIMESEWKDERPYQYGEIYVDRGKFGPHPGLRACNYRLKDYVDGVECDSDYNFVASKVDDGTDLLSSLLPIIEETKQLSQFFGAMEQFAALPDDILASIDKLQSYQPRLDKLQSYIKKKEYSEIWSYLEGPTFTFGSKQCGDDSQESPDSPDSPESADSDDESESNED